MEQSSFSDFGFSRFAELLGIFENRDSYAATYRTVLERHPLSGIRELEGEDLEARLGEIESRDDVQALQNSLRYEFIGIEPNLHTLARTVARRHLTRITIHGEPLLPVTAEGEIKARVSSYRDISAWCNGCGHNIANGLVTVKTPQEKVVLSPEDLIYADNMPAIFSRGRLKCDNCPSDEVYYTQDGQTLVYKPLYGGVDDTSKTTKHEFIDQIVKGIVARAAKRVETTTGIKASKIENKIYSALGEVFPTVRGLRRGQKGLGMAYRIFELVARKNISLTQVPKYDDQIRGALEAEIAAANLLPYVVIKMRAKSLGSSYRKLLGISYGIYDETKSGASGPIVFEDLRGIRFVLRSKFECELFLKALDKDPDFKFNPNDVKNYNKEPKENKYESIHLHPRYKNAVFSFQIRDHGADLRAEREEAQTHYAYIMSKIGVMRRQIPYQDLRFHAAMLGVYDSPLLFRRN